MKRAYRRLSREKHPDKNPDNPDATAEFLEITKAYTILTDPVARENFEMYGSPDGYGHFHVSVALPRWITSKEYQLYVLLLFFIVVVVLIPGYFYIQVTQDEKDVGGVNPENRKLFNELIDENMLGKKVPGILC